MYSSRVLSLRIVPLLLREIPDVPLLKPLVHGCSLYDVLNQGVQIRFVVVVGRGKVADALLPHHFPDLGLVLRCRVKDPYGVPAVGAHKLHAWDVGVAVADVDHVAERNPDLFRREAVVHSRIIDIEHSLLNPEEELGLPGVVDGLRRPPRDTGIVKIER